MGVEVLIAAGIAAAVSAGTYAVNYALAGSGPKQHIDNARTIDPRVQGSRYGAFIPRTYGTVEMAGQVIWASSILDTPTTTPAQNSKRGSTPEQTNHKYTRSFAVLFCTGPKAGITRLTADDKTYYESATLGEVVTDKLHIYTGSDSQMPNSWIEADKGVGKVSAHRGYVVVVFKDFPIDSYGDRIPNIRAEIVESADDVTLEHVVESECLLAGLTTSDIETSALAEQVVEGYFVNQQGPVRSSLEQLSKAFQFYGAEYDGKINFNTLPQAPKMVVPWEDLGAIEDEDSADEDEPQPRITIKRKQSQEIAKSVSVVYFDKNRAYEEGTQTYTRQLLSSRAVASHGFNLVMQPAFASRLAKIIAVTGWTERVPVEFNLPPDYFVYAAGDVLTVPKTEGGETIDVRIEKMTFSAPGVVRCTGVQQFAEAYNQTGDESGTEGEDPPDVPPVEDPCDVYVWMDDRPPFRAGEEGVPGHYIAIRPHICDPLSGRLRGASIVRNVDGDGDYRAHAVITETATMGVLLTTLADHAAGLDTTNTVDVHLDNGSIASITDAAFTADQTVNLFAIGGETCQARDVLDLGDGDYRLSHIRRGMFDTTHSAHSIDEDIVLLDSKVKRVTHNLAEVGRTYEFVGVPFGKNIEDGSSFNFTYGARGVEPGGDVPSAPLTPTVATNNGNSFLRWETPADNNKTIRGYKVTVYTDASMTLPLAGYEDVEVTGNQVALPQDTPGTPLYYEVKAENALGQGAPTSGSFTPTAPTAGAHAASHASGGTDPLTGNLDANARVGVRVNGAGSTHTRRRVNAIAGAGVTLAVADDAGDEEVELTITADKYAIRTITTAATAALTDQVIFINVTSGAVTLSLPTAVGNGGKWFSVKVTGTGNNLATLDPNASETFDGLATVELAVGDRLRFISDGSNWQSIA
jgi:hypothetical protein